MYPLGEKLPVWAIIVGDDRFPEWVPYGALDLKAVPVQYCRLTALASPFQRAVHLAAAIASVSRVLVTALPEHRARWEPYTWFVRPSMRFINEGNAASRIALAAAILSVADRSPSNVLAIIPARSHVVHEFILRDALKQMVARLPEVPEGVASLGMIDMDDSVDEDYLVLQRSSGGQGLNVSGIARRPTAWVARHLRRQGAVVASGILVGYAGAFAAHLSKHWPGVTAKLTRLSQGATEAKQECIVPSTVGLGVPSTVRHCLRWDPPLFKQRVFTVSQCGWSGLKSPHAVARIADFVSKEETYRRQHLDPENRFEHA
jgi:hypothetical protein